MHTRRPFPTALAILASTALLVFAVFVSASSAQPAWSDRTEFSFDAPVEVPGATLPAGRYVFRLADSMSNRQIVQIWNADQTKLMATTMAIPASRAETTGDVVVKFASTAPGTAPAMKAWFYPGQTTGHAFVYPEEQARRIARTTKTLVLSADADPANRAEAAKAMIAEITERGERRPFDVGSRRYTTHEAPPVMAAPAEAADGSGRVTVHGLEGEDLAEHYLQHIVETTTRMLERGGQRIEVSRSELEGLRSDAQRAFAALDGKSS